MSWCPNTPKNCWWDALQRALNCSLKTCILCSATSSRKMGFMLTGSGNNDPMSLIWTDTGGCVAIYDNSNLKLIALHRNDGGNFDGYCGWINW